MELSEIGKPIDAPQSPKKQRLIGVVWVTLPKARNQACDEITGTLESNKRGTGLRCLTALVF